MDKKILVVGNKTRKTDDLLHLVGEYFQVKTSDPEVASVYSVLMVFKPDLIIVNLENISSVKKIFGLMNKSSSGAGILAVGATADHGQFNFSEYTRVKDLSIDTIGDALLEEVCSYLKVSLEEVKKESKTKNKSGRMRILLIDDSPLFLRLGKSMLEEEFDVDMATSAQKGFQSLERNRADLILLDYNMPGYDGIETYEKFKASKKYNEIPIVFLTGVTDRKKIIKAMKQRPAGYVLKPVEKEELLKIIYKVLGINLDKL